MSDEIVSFLEEHSGELMVTLLFELIDSSGGKVTLDANKVLDNLRSGGRGKIGLSIHSNELVLESISED